jgi:hypothetical protein
LGDGVTTYRVLIFGHDLEGRLGFYEGQFQAAPPRK